MQSNISHNLLEQLVTTAKQQGIERLAVGAVIRKGAKVLLLERIASDFLGGLVELPNGAVEKDEDLLVTLVREVHEETGLRIDEVLSYLDYFDYTAGSGQKTRQFNFSVEVESGEIKLNQKEHQAYHFVAPSDKEFGKFNISAANKATLQNLTESYN